MRSCWESSPKARPCFKDLESILESYMEDYSVSLYMHLITHATTKKNKDENAL